MPYRDIGPITAADADADDDRLFDDAAPPELVEGPAPVALPDDLIARGFTLIVRAPNAMFAVSTQWGCTGTKGMLGAVVREARGLVGFCTAVDRRKQRADS